MSSQAQKDLVIFEFFDAATALSLIALNDMPGGIISPFCAPPTVTAVLLPDGHDADAFRNLALENFNISYGASFGRYAGKYFRIGHLGDVNDGMLVGALGITEMALALAGIPHKKGGVQAAMDYIVSAHSGGTRAAAE